MLGQVNDVVNQEVSFDKYVHFRILERLYQDTLVIREEEKARRSALSRLEVVNGLKVQGWDQRFHDVFVTLDTLSDELEKCGGMLYHLNGLILASHELVDAHLGVLSLEVLWIDVIRLRVFNFFRQRVASQIF